jgi:hypothetical protein
MVVPDAVEVSIE